MTQQQSDNLFDDGELDAAIDAGRAGEPVPKRFRSVSVRGLEVTQADIDDAMRADSHSCMIAEAVKRSVPGAKNVAVDLQSIRWTDTKNARRVVCFTPMRAQQGLLEFDFGLTPKPFKFNVRSFQVTGLQVKRKRLDPATGEALRDENGKLLYSTASQPTSRAAMVSLRNDLSNGEKRSVQPANLLKVGGSPPPLHKASRHRKFGVKGFTWEDGEDPEAIARRQNAAAGRDPEFRG